VSYVPTLDGWRAIAVLIVMAFHDRIHSLGPISTQWLQENGKLGVHVFFAISGILIVSRLLEEKRLNGAISLKRFYTRRAFRILPAALTFLVVAGLLILLGVYRATLLQWLGALLFFQNLLPKVPGYGWITGHFWSLSLEEQFYFLIPALLCLSTKKLKVVLPALLVISYAWSLYCTHRGWTATHEGRFDLAIHVLLLPALVAFALTYPRARTWIQRLTWCWPLWLIAPFLVLRMQYAVKDLLMDVALTGLVVGTTLNPTSWLGIALEWPWLRWIGRLSYSLYLWQEIFLGMRFAPEQHPRWMQSSLLGWSLSFAAACASYYLLEERLVRVGHRLAPSATIGRPTDVAA
jgi:peptidoglycan/LPS O-acetylase OafA/YrhL